jgi:hypothetical protein
MKKSPSGPDVKKQLAKIPRVLRDDALMAFKKLGFAEDVNDLHVTILREIDFPFRRIALPNTPKISLELIKVHLNEVGIDLQLFIDIVNS